MLGDGREEEDGDISSANSSGDSSRMRHISTTPPPEDICRSALRGPRPEPEREQDGSNGPPIMALQLFRSLFHFGSAPSRGQLPLRRTPHPNPSHTIATKNPKVRVGGRIPNLCALIPQSLFALFRQCVDLRKGVQSICFP